MDLLSTSICSLWIFEVRRNNISAANDSFTRGSWTPICWRISLVGILSSSNNFGGPFSYSRERIVERQTRFYRILLKLRVYVTSRRHACWLENYQYHYAEHMNKMEPYKQFVDAASTFGSKLSKVVIAEFSPFSVSGIVFLIHPPQTLPSAITELFHVHNNQLGIKLTCLTWQMMQWQSKERQTAVVWSCLPFIRSGQNNLGRHSERGNKTRQTEGEVGRQHQGKDRPGVPQVPESSGEQAKMEKTSCKIICGAPTTLAVKGLIMMMMSGYLTATFSVNNNVNHCVSCCLH